MHAVYLVHAWYKPKWRKPTDGSPSLPLLLTLCMSVPILAMAVCVLAFTGSEQTDIPQTYGQQGVRGDLRKRHMAAKITCFAGLQLVIQMLSE